jgi:hypothetical protein
MKNLKHIGFLIILFISNLTIAQGVICDDFTDLDLYPELIFDAEELLGYSQGGTQTITSGVGTFGHINGSEPGIYAVGPVDFSFDGTYQNARFLVYGFDYQFDEMGFSVNGSETIFLDDVFPMTVLGVDVDIDLSPENVDDWEYFYLTFTGAIDVIQHELFESAVVELCVESLFEDGDCDDFYNADVWNWDDNYETGDLLGNTQGGLYPVTCTDGHGWINDDGDITGIIIGEGAVEFEFSGVNQHARFKIYHSEPSEEYGFSVNGGTTYYINDIFPLVTGGVIVDFDTSPEDDVDFAQVSYLSFTGELSSVEHIALESGIIELCVETLFDDGDCDDFTDLEYYPEESFPIDVDMIGDIIGTTQGGTQPITIAGTGPGFSWLDINTEPDFGLYGGCELDFAFDGSNQSARFLVYGWIGDGTEIGFSVNGSTFVPYDETFPMVVDGIAIDMDLSPPDDIGSFESFYLTLSGNLDVITQTIFESGIQELCVEPLLVEGCADFTDPIVCPVATYSGEGFEGTIIGYSQDGTQPITLGVHDVPSIYCYTSSFGIYTGGSTIDFSFDGSPQSARFHLGESTLGPGTGRTFSVNGSTYTSIHGVYPMIIDGIIIDYDSITVPDLIAPYTDVYLTFSGDLYMVSLRADIFHESNIIELCVESIFDEDDCDDFYNADEWYVSPEYSEGDLLGYTQDDAYAVTCTDGHGTINTFGETGIVIGEGSVEFEMNGANQNARFTIYHTGLTTDFGFSANGATYNYLDATFPIVIDGITIDLDTSPEDPDIDDDIWGDLSYLIFTGELSTVEFTALECGIVELCVETIVDIDVACDDFTAEPWPMDEIFEPGEVIGYTYDATFPVTVGATGAVYVNTDPVYFPGLFINNAPLIFEFDGSDQSVQFEIYEWFGAGSEGFELNGEPLTLFDDTYPMTIDGVVIDIEFLGLPVGTAELAHITFSGEIDEIVMVGGELGVTGICYDSDSTILVGAGLNKEKKSLISVYPNPADKFIAIASNEPIQDVRIYTIAGALVHTLGNINKNQVTLDTEELEQGLYLVEMFLSDGRRVIEKVILE